MLNLCSAISRNVIIACSVSIIRSLIMTPLTLYYLPSWSCEDFIIYCEIHRMQYLSVVPKKALNAVEPTCCEFLFNETPIFTFSGTCFTTKIPVMEYQASIYSSMQIWLQLDRDRTPGKNNYFSASPLAQETEGPFNPVTPQSLTQPVVSIGSFLCFLSSFSPLKYFRL